MIDLSFQNGAGGSAIALLTINRAPANAFIPEALRSLESTVERLDEDHRVRAIIVTGNGPKFFSAGADLKTFADGNKEGAREVASCFGRAFEALQNARTVVIAAINGRQGVPLQAALALERERFVELFDSVDQREGVNAFLEKRAPQWALPENGGQS